MMRSGKDKNRTGKGDSVGVYLTILTGRPFETYRSRSSLWQATEERTSQSEVDSLSPQP